MDDLIKSIGRLRQDALDRGMLDLCVVYGWSQILLGEEQIDRQMTKLEQYKMVQRDMR